MRVRGVNRLRLLLVEDDAALVDLVRRGLVANGYRVDWEQEGDQGYDRACTGTYDVIILDLMLPDLDGLELLTELRVAGVHTPILCLTARGSIQDRVDGLDAGADDYMVKPFAFQELLARVRALLRRPAAGIVAQLLSAGNLHLDLDKHLVVVAGRAITVPPREFDLLEYLLHNAGRTLTREQFLDRVWGADAAPKANVADATVSRLRRRLRSAGWDGQIVAVPGLGYRLVAGDQGL